MSFGSTVINTIVKMQGRDVEYIDFENDLTYNIKAAPANYFRDYSASEEVTFPGREYVLSVDELTRVGYVGAPQKNHRIVDSALGDRVIEEVREMVVFGKICGYRVRTN